MRSLTRRLLAGTSATSLALAPLPSVANPLGGQVVGGAASIQGQGTANVVVNQSTNRAIIDWRTFNIAPGETTQFVQPSQSSVTLNRVTGGLGFSTINGTIKANGGVYIVNPDGLLFGPSAKINVGSFLGTTHDIANSDFMAGSNAFTISGNPSASIVNQGTITAAKGGFAALVAPGVRNDGVITANLGTVALASGNAFTLDMYGDSLIKLQAGDSIAGSVRDVATGQTLSSLVTNTGILKANGGKVALTAVAARKVVDSVINSSGVVEANTVGTRKGLVVFGAATADTKPAGAPVQTVKVSGKIKAAGRKAGTTGGKIQITGENIQLASAKLNASGKAGGGTILVGGDIQGGSPRTTFTNPRAVLESTPVPQASTVSADSGSVLDASATGSGSGGKVVVWANDETRFFGKALATGGPAGGDGGFVEISSPKVLTLAGTVDVTAPKGAAGTAFFDPTYAYVVSSLPSCVSSSSGCGSNSYIAAYSLSSGTISADTIDIDAAVSTAGSLYLNAGSSITSNFNLSSSGVVSITAPAIALGAPVSGYAGVTINAGTSLAPTPAITSSIGVISITAPDINIAGSLGAGAAVSLNASNSISINAPLTVTGMVPNILEGYYGQNSNITAPMVAINAPIAFTNVAYPTNFLYGSYKSGLDLNPASVFTGTGSISVTGDSVNFSLPANVTATGPWAFTNSVVSLTTAADTVTLPPASSLTNSSLTVVSTSPKTITLSGGYSQDANSTLTCSTGCFQTLNIDQATIAGTLSAQNINVSSGASLASATLNASNALVVSGSSSSIGDNVTLSADTITFSSPSQTFGANFSAVATSNIEIASRTLSYGQGTLQPGARLTAGNQITFDSDTLITGAPIFSAPLIAGAGKTLTIVNSAALDPGAQVHMSTSFGAGFSAAEIDPNLALGANTALGISGLNDTTTTTTTAIINGVLTNIISTTPTHPTTTIAGNVSTGADSYVEISATNLQLNGTMSLGADTTFLANAQYSALINGSLTASKNTSTSLNVIGFGAGYTLLINSKIDLSNLDTSSDAAPFAVNFNAGAGGPYGSIGAGPNAQVIGGVGPIWFQANNMVGMSPDPVSGLGPIPVSVIPQAGTNSLNFAACALASLPCGTGGTSLIAVRYNNPTNILTLPPNGAFFNITAGAAISNTTVASSSSPNVPPEEPIGFLDASPPTASGQIGVAFGAYYNNGGHTATEIAEIPFVAPVGTSGSTLDATNQSVVTLDPSLSSQPSQPSGTPAGISDSSTPSSNAAKQLQPTSVSAGDIFLQTSDYIAEDINSFALSSEVLERTRTISLAVDLFNIEQENTNRYGENSGLFAIATVVDIGLHFEQNLLARELGPTAAVVVLGQKLLFDEIIGMGRMAYASILK